MQKDNRFFDDMARLATGAAGSLAGVKQEIDAMIDVQLEKCLQKMQLASREELNTVLAMMTKIREEQEIINKRLDKITQK